MKILRKFMIVVNGVVHEPYFAIIVNREYVGSYSLSQVYSHDYKYLLKIMEPIETFSTAFV